eukprot:scaffold26_cov158-Amphora_coffeaeformis.AAC.2
MSGTPDYDTHDEETPPSSSMSEIPLELGEPSLPNPEEIRMSARDVNTNNNNGSGGGRRCVWYSVLGIILVVSVVAIVVGLSSSSSSGGGSRGGTGGASGSNSAPRQFSFEALAAYLEEEGISDPQELLSFPTPQSQAARWLANEDTRNLALPSEGVESKQGYHFITRYILATIYYAMSGSDWRFQFNFMSEDDICDWRDTLYVINTGEPVPFGSLCDATSGEIFRLYLGTLFDAIAFAPLIESDMTLIMQETNISFSLQSPALAHNRRQPVGRFHSFGNYQTYHPS